MIILTQTLYEHSFVIVDYIVFHNNQMLPDVLFSLLIAVSFTLWPVPEPEVSSDAPAGDQEALQPHLGFATRRNVWASSATVTAVVATMLQCLLQFASTYCKRKRHDGI